MTAEQVLQPAAETAEVRAAVREVMVAEVGEVPLKAESGREERENEPETVVVVEVLGDAARVLALPGEVVPVEVAVAVAVAEAVAEAVAALPPEELVELETPQVEEKPDELVLCAPNMLVGMVM